MDVNPVGLIGQTSPSTDSASGLAQNFDNFLQLLTTQLQNQDPLSPLDSTEFTSQLVQFASVEQQIGANKNLEELISLQKRNQAVGAVDFLGKTVEAFGDTTLLTGGKAEFTYTLPSDAANVSIAIRNAQGLIVRTLDGETGEGKHTFVWDGLDDQGQPLPDGPYQIQVAAQDADDNPLDVVTGVIGTVTGVAAENGIIVLKIGDITIPIDQVVSVTGNGAGTQSGTPPA